MYGVAARQHPLNHGAGAVDRILQSEIEGYGRDINGCDARILAQRQQARRRPQYLQELYLNNCPLLVC